MTLHAAKGLEFDVVNPAGLGKKRGIVSPPAIPGRERPGRTRRGAAPRLCRTNARAPPGEIYFAANPPHPRAVADDAPCASSTKLPEAHVEVVEASGAFGAWRLWRLALRPGRAVSSTYQTPGWRRARESSKGGGFAEQPSARVARGPAVIEGGDREIQRRIGARQRRAGLSHQIWPGSVVAVDGSS